VAFAGRSCRDCGRPSCHDQSADDIYQLVLAALEIEMPEGERLKPPCCDDLESPPVDAEVADLIAAAIDALARRSRRG